MEIMQERNDKSTLIVELPTWLIYALAEAAGYLHLTLDEGTAVALNHGLSVIKSRGPVAAWEIERVLNEDLPFRLELAEKFLAQHR